MQAFGRSLLVVFVACMLCIGGLLVYLVIEPIVDAPPSTPQAAPTADTQPDQPPAPAAPQPVKLAIPAGAQAATVKYVHDGDTLFLTVPGNNNLKVRLLAVDTPEVGENYECYGDEATAYLESLAPEGSTLYTLADREPLDQYGRSLLFLWTADGTAINISLVQNGFAEAVFIGKNRLYENQVEAAEDAAQAASLGIWGAC